jgi:hypothetical protein
LNGFRQVWLNAYWTSSFVTTFPPYLVTCHNGFFNLDNLVLFWFAKEDFTTHLIRQRESFTDHSMLFSAEHAE